MQAELAELSVKNTKYFLSLLPCRFHLQFGSFTFKVKTRPVLESCKSKNTGGFKFVVNLGQFYMLREGDSVIPKITLSHNKSKTSKALLYKDADTGRVGNISTTIQGPGEH